MRPLKDWNPIPISLVLGLFAGLYRAWLCGHYWGHEEEDWGNLQVIAGLLGDPFGPVETEHMPLFTWLGAIASTVLGDPELGAEAVAVVAGAGTVALTTWLGWRWLSPLVGIIAGILCALQPEAALYSASPLRESLFTLLMLAGVGLFGSRRPLLGALVLAAAFLARFNIAFSILPAMALWSLLPAHWRVGTSPPQGEPPVGRGLSTSGSRELVAACLLVAAVLGWAFYYESVEGTYRFWGGVMDRNTGNAVSDLFVGERITATFGALAGLALVVIPSHVGWLLVPLGLLGAARPLVADVSRPEAARWLALCGAATLSLLLATALVSTYEWRHNLYWKWLTPSVPYFCIFGAHGVAVLLALGRQQPLIGGHVLGRLPRSFQVPLAMVLLVALTLPGYQAETQRQLIGSSLAYGTQVRISSWFEDALPEDSGLLTWAYSIPAAYLQRVPSDRRLYDWSDPSLPQDSPELFGAWLAEQHIGMVIFHREEGTGALDAAAYLASGEPRALGPVQLRPLVDEAVYGTIAYLVEAPGFESPEDIPAPSYFLGQQ